MARHRAERPDEDDTDVEENTDLAESAATGDPDDADPDDDDTDDDDPDDDDTDDDDPDDDDPDDDSDDDSDDDEEPTRSAAADEWWSDVRVDVVELALPSGVGYTLRAYRMTDEFPPGDDAEEAAEEEPAPAPKATGKGKRKEEPARPSGKHGKHRATDEEREEEDLEVEELDEEELDEEELADEDLEEEEEEEEKPEPQEIPTFLAHDGRLLLFRTPEALVSFVRSDAPHDLTAIDTWERVAAEIEPDRVTALPDDKYELDLVVDNLRGGHDAWDPDLVVSAGEVARDLGYALRIEQILTALSPDSPLDDLDEAMRAAAGGGLGSFFARRRLKKIGAQQAALAWRTIIGKITTATDWRD